MALTFPELLLAEVTKMRGLAIVLMGNKSAADDLIQQTALRAWQYQTTFEIGTNFRAWIYRILRNEHLQVLRASKSALAALDDVTDAIIERDATQEDSVLTQEVFAAISKMPKARQEVLILVCVSGLDYAEAARVIGCSMAALKGKLFRARQVMQALILPAIFQVPDSESPSERRGIHVGNRVRTLH